MQNVTERVFSSSVSGVSEGGTNTRRFSPDIAEYVYGRKTTTDSVVSDEPRLYLCLHGRLNLYWNGTRPSILNAGDVLKTPGGVPVGVRTLNGCTFTEVTLRGESQPSASLRTGQVITLCNLVPYLDDRIVTRDLINDQHVRFSVMSFARGTSLEDVLTPWDSLYYLLEGDLIVECDGRQYQMEPGEYFKCDKDMRYSVYATGPCKTATLTEY